MRIISGIYKGKALKFPKSIRPTQSIARKGLFDIMFSCVKGSRFLDLFAGSGSVGIEAASLGAENVVFVENSLECAQIIEANIKSIISSDKSEKPDLITEVLRMDAFSVVENFSKNKIKFNIVFVDPPYYNDLAKNCLIKISNNDIVSPNGFVIIQHSKRDSLSDKEGDFSCFKRAKYGDSLLSFYQK